MDYMQEPFAFPAQHQPQMYYQAIPYPPSYMAHPQQPLDDLYPSLRYNANDYADYMASGMMADDFGPEMEEISTRPRLTKEQVEVLEAQFQANHKPNSQVKRQLAIQTNLKFQRVGNWFQNRRAKAKQQKRQEEYETQKAAEKKEPTSGETIKTPKPRIASPVRSVSSSPRKASIPARDRTPSPTKNHDSAKESSWDSLQASLQRTLGHPKAHQPEPMAQQKVLMIPPQMPQPVRPIAVQLPLRVSPHRANASLPNNLPAWTSSAVPQHSPITLQDNTFDFGFDDDQIDVQRSLQDAALVDSFINQESYVSPEDLHGALTTPKGGPLQQNDAVDHVPSPGFSLPSYPGSRRQSTAITDELSHNFGNCALASSSPNGMARRRPSEPIQHPSSGPLDIAARRKRPRPTPLASASLRSRSYGALTSVSPTFRPSAAAPAMPHSIRHVKSAGQALNSRYAGIRKASSAQRSPITPSFAETQAFSHLMAQQALNAQTLADFPAPALSPDIVSSAHMTDPEKNPFFGHNMDMSGQYSLQGQTFPASTASPPITPLPSDFMMARGTSQQSLVPPASAPPQYASFPEYTPPYSAGPLTNSSWSDALTSPEVTSFPPVTYVPSLNYSQQGDALSGSFQQFVLPSDTTPDIDFEAQMEQKKTEFYIQEFPNQKEEHAHVAQQLAQQKPKNYVFANTAPQDYTGE
ncbi:hypothetical protein PV08_07787 [Exophiala spinifera]|uniref:Homeobox domain-containing protein n=1 Tax=Exophiala spinifera TaxID=91928 RepID=A0A0D2B8P0_9EURO|nr:uncharacterized protein PV08_07787 [Exophiala spinifera]KIW15000.1 hypothetical protein PV08_07787 [Exophiala spinifera]